MVDLASDVRIKEVEVQKLQLRPGDVVLFTVPTAAPQSWVEKLRLHLKRLLPRNEFVIVGRDVKASVIRKEETTDG